MSIKDWKNGRKLSDPKEFQDIKDMFFAVDPELGEQDWELEEKRKRSKINQAR